MYHSKDRVLKYIYYNVKITVARLDKNDSSSKMDICSPQKNITRIWKDPKYILYIWGCYCFPLLKKIETGNINEKFRQIHHQRANNTSKYQIKHWTFEEQLNAFLLFLVNVSKWWKTWNTERWWKTTINTERW